MKGGIKVESISNSELKGKMAINSVTVVDVRKPDEYNENHIDNAISIPLEELEDNLDKINKEEEIHLICNSGKKASMAKQILDENGFKDAIVVIPGMNKW